MSAKKETLGVRLNNPGNLEWGSPWEGLVPRSQSLYARSGTAQQKRFAQFVDAAAGIRAIIRTLITYADKRQAADGSTIDTVQEIVERWAPSHENDVDAYAKHVASFVGVGPRDPISIKDYDTMKAIVTGIIAHENAGYEYPSTVVGEAMRRAGLVRRPAKKAVPVNTETVAGAAAPGVIGLGAAAEVAPQVASAIGDQQDNLNSGNWVQIAIAVLLVTTSLVVIWSQYKKRKDGVL